MENKMNKTARLDLYGSAKQPTPRRVYPGKRRT